MKLQEAIERAEHSACAGGHSELIVRADRPRQIRLTYLRPYDRYGDPMKDVPDGFVFGAISIDERASETSNWERFQGFSYDDVIANDWGEVAVATTNSRGRCVAPECFQHGHGGGWKLTEPTEQVFPLERAKGHWSKEGAQI